MKVRNLIAAFASALVVCAGVQAAKVNVINDTNSPVVATYSYPLTAIPGGFTLVGPSNTRAKGGRLYVDVTIEPNETRTLLKSDFVLQHDDDAYIIKPTRELDKASLIVSNIIKGTPKTTDFVIVKGSGTD